MVFPAFNNIRNPLLSTQQIVYNFQNNAAMQIVTTTTTTTATTTTTMVSPPLSLSIQAQQLQCSNGNNTMSFGELVRTHYDKLKLLQQDPSSSSNTSNNRLKFVHIAKTGGTAIEIAAAKGNVSWGVCHWHNGHFYKQYRCPPLPSSKNEEPSLRVMENGGIPRIAYWHKTAQHYDVRAPGRKPGTDNNYDPYANASLFAVVRNPYNRIISEYYYDTRRGRTPAHVLNNATRLNTWVSEMLRPLQGATMGFIQLVPTKSSETVVLPANRHYYQQDSHYLPQYDYFYDGERRVVHHAIHFEHLSNEFRKLMEQYNLSQKVILPNVDHKEPENMSGRHTPNKQLGLHNLTLENTRLIEFVYARDFVFFGYPARTHVLENQYQPGSRGADATEAAAGNRRRRLEFVHIPQTGGRLIEMAAAAARIPWGACHFVSNTRIENIKQQSSSTSHQDDELSWCPVAHTKQLLDPNEMHKLLPAQLQEMKNHLWNLPSHYFEKLLSPTTIDQSSKGLHNPYDDGGDAALFVVVRNPYDRVISTYYSVHGQENQATNDMAMMNDATYMNEWLYRHLVAMRGTISTARQVDATSFPTNPAYYQFAGRFIPQYDFVYDFVYDEQQGQRRVVDHVLHFESLTTEFPALMNGYYANDGGQGGRRPVLPEIKDSAKLEALLECTKSRSLGIANLTLQNVRLIEFVYARDFAAFGYKSMTYHLENQYPPNLPPTNE
jgi:Sulfotransferase family